MTTDDLPNEVRSSITELTSALTEIVAGKNTAKALAEVRSAAERAVDAARAAREDNAEQPEWQGVIQFQEVIGKRLRAAREMAGRTQAQLAEAMTRLAFNWKRITVAEVERGSRRVSFEELLGLAALFGVPMMVFANPPPGARIKFAGTRSLDAVDVQELLVGPADRRLKPGGDPDWPAARHAASLKKGDSDWRPVVDASILWTEHLKGGEEA